jgi:hypothetical protein
MPRLLPFAVSLLQFAIFLPAIAPAQQPAPLPELPVINRPPLFDEERSPIGSFREPVVKAEPTELQAEDPLTFTLRLIASGPVLRPPGRPRLEKFPGFADDFDIEPLGDGDGRIDPQTWEFAYRLRPRRAEVQAIPSIPFVYFVPGQLPAHRGYQTRYTSAIELKVRPRAEVRPSDVAGPRPPRGPDSLYQLAEGPGLYRRQQPDSLPGLPALLILFLFPPLACAGWYWLWSQFYPDAARLVRLRRSRAARLALQALHHLGASDTILQAERTAAIVAEYLRQRFDLSAAEPTPDEVETSLQRAGVPSDLAGRVAEFFRRCDAVRFGPGLATDPTELIAGAEELLLALEAPAETSGLARAAVGTFVLLCLLPALAAAGVWSDEPLRGPEEWFREGLRLQEQSPKEAREAFREAARRYGELRLRGSHSPALCRNEGNAWLLSGDVARAIVSYRRGLLLAPNDAALRANLAYAREQVAHAAPGGFGRPPIDNRPPWLPRIGPLWLLALTLGLYSAACVLFTRWRMTRRGGMLVVAGVLLAAAVLPGTALALEEWQRREEKAHPLVVIAEDGVLLYKGNGTAYPHYEAPLSAGVEARLRFERGDWLQIELAGGEVGWVPQKYALVDRP